MAETQTKTPAPPSVEEALKAAGLSPEQVSRAMKAVAPTMVPKPVELKTWTGSGEPMRLAKCRLALDKNGDVAKDQVTPAEVLLLVSDHHNNVQDIPVTEIVEYPEGAIVESGGAKRYRTDDEELKRLRSRYPMKRVNAIFAGAQPKLPKTFEEAITAGRSVAVPTDNLGIVIKV